MRYLALDQALKTSAWSFFQDGNFVKCGTWTIPANKSVDARLYEIWKHLDSLYEELGFGYLFFEDIQKQQNAETFKKLAYVQAAVLLWCYMREIPYSILAPSHWRSILKDKYGVAFGKARKEQKAASIKFVKDLLDKNVTEDEADAICIGYAGLIEKNSNISAW